MNTHAISANGSPVDPATGDVPVVVYQRKTILTDAQIKAGSTTYITVVPAPGPGKLLQFFSAAIILNTTGAGYTNLHADNALFVGYGDWDQDGSQIIQMVNGVGQTVYVIGVGSVNEERASWAGYQNPAMYGNSSAFENKPLKLITSNGDAGDFTGGDPSNTLEVTVFYSVVDL